MQIEEWKNGRMEDWKIGRLEDFAIRPPVCWRRNLQLPHPIAALNLWAISPKAGV
jgi:hypothetical protein